MRHDARSLVFIDSSGSRVGPAVSQPPNTSSLSAEWYVESVLGGAGFGGGENRIAKKVVQ